MGLQYLGGCIGGLEVAAVADRFLDVLAVGAGAAIAVVLQSTVLHIQVFGVHIHCSAVLLRGIGVNINNV